MMERQMESTGAYEQPMQNVLNSNSRKRREEEVEVQEEEEEEKKDETHR